MASCTVHERTNGTVTCDRQQYARGLCNGHYKQWLLKRPFVALKKIDPEVELVEVAVRVRRPFHDQLLLAAAEHGVSPYEMHRQIFETWAERRLKKAAGKAVAS